MYEKARQLEPENVNIPYSLARYLFGLGDFDPSEKEIAAVLQKQPGHFPARMLKSELLIARREYKPAIEILDKLVQDEPKSARAFYFKGAAHLGVGDSTLARTALVRSLELEGGNSKARLLLAEAYLKERDAALAQKEVMEVLKAEPGHYQAKLLLGSIYMGQRKSEEAKEVFEALVKADPNNPAGYYQLGTLLRINRQFDQARVQFEKALALNPRLLDAFSSLVGVHAARGEFDRALAICDQRLKSADLSPEEAGVLYNLKGGVYLARGDEASAEGAFREALNRNPNFMQAYYALAGLYLRGGQSEKAIRQFQALLDVNPRQVVPHAMIGIIYDSQKQFDLSEKHYRAALVIDPKFAPAANNLAYILAEANRDLNEALMLAQTAKERMPEDPNVMDTLGWVYYKKGLYDSAIGEFKDSLAKSPDNAPVVYHLAMALYKKGEKDQSRAEFERALKMDGAFAGADEAKRILAELK
jgi:tetratricopeptide (TPR) repeat protein